MLRAIRERVGADYIVGIRMAVDEQHRGRASTHPPGSRSFAGSTNEALIDFVNVIRGSIVNDAVLIGSDPDPWDAVGAAPRLRRHGPRRDRARRVLHASKIDDVATARHAISEGLVDMVGMTRAQMADPHLVRKIELGVEHTIRPCVGATYCLDRIYQVGRGAVHPQRGDRPRADDAARHTSRAPAVDVS